jgi:hypothetical protein
LSRNAVLKVFGAKHLPALPAASIGDDFLLLIVDGEQGGICFDREVTAHVAWRHTVAITVE